MPPGPPPEDQDAGSGPLGLGGWISLGVGGASLVTSIVLGAMASSRAIDVELANDSGTSYWDDQQDLMSSGEALETGQIVTLAVGGTLVAAGVTLLLLDRLGRSAEKRAWVAPVIRQGGGMVTAGFQF